MNVFTALERPIVDRPGDPIPQPKRPARPRYTPVERPTREPLDPDLVANPWGLADMQCRVLQLLVAGKSRSEAAAVLGISVKTVDVHIERARERMGVPSTLQAALKFDRHYREAA